jgi:hypothetical protein
MKWECGDTLHIAQLGFPPSKPQQMARALRQGRSGPFRSRGTGSRWGRALLRVPTAIPYYPKGWSTRFSESDRRGR